MASLDYFSDGIKFKWKWGREGGTEGGNGGGGGLGWGGFENKEEKVKPLSL